MASRPIIALDMPTEEEPLNDKQRAYIDVQVEKSGFVPNVPTVYAWHSMKFDAFTRMYTASPMTIGFRRLHFSDSGPFGSISDARAHFRWILISGSSGRWMEACELPRPFEDRQVP